ncbi:MAG TPA: iron uptake system protein EfeO [Gaiellales bacterium]
MSRSWSRTGVAAVAAVLIAVAAAGCGGSSSKASAPGTKTVSMTLTDEGCSPAKISVPAGPVTFNVSNSGSAKVTEFELKNQSGIIVGEQENVVEGIDGSFSVRIDPGKYVLSCPNGSGHDTGELTATGTASSPRTTISAAVVTKATTGYHDYIVAQSAKLLTGTRTFVAALDRGDLAAAKTQFGPLRAYYERIEPVAESFGNLDPAIDARVNDVPSVKSWTGFHRIEQILWVKGTTDGTKPFATRLLRDVTTLNTKVQTLTFQPAQLANGAVELLNEVAGSKITGEEDRYSHTDLSDFEANVAGAREAFVLLKPALIERGDGALAKTLTARFAAVEQGLAPYKRPTPLGYALYGELTPKDRKSLAQAVDSLAEPLSMVASKVLV